MPGNHFTNGLLTHNKNYKMGHSPKSCQPGVVQDKKPFILQGFLSLAASDGPYSCLKQDLYEANCRQEVPYME